MQIKLEPLPMEEAKIFWKDKVKLGPKEFSKLSDEAKVRAFAVGGIAKGDELDTVFNALQKAIDKGIPFAEFKKECGDIFERRGWTGKKAWRVDNIFRTNIQTAYNTGHYKQLVTEQDIFTHWQYSAINDSRTRPTHLAMDGRVWPADHKTWDTWFPPNGFRCRCSVIGLTKGQVKNRALKVEEHDPTNRLIEPIDQKSGNRMPARQLLPDQGFALNPGKEYWKSVGDVLHQQLEKYPEKLAVQVLSGMVAEEGFELFLKKPAGDFPVLRLHETAAAALESDARVAVFSKASIEKNLKHHPELTVNDYRKLPLIGAEPEIIIRTRDKTVVLIHSKDGWYLAAVKVTGDRKELFVTSFRKTNGKDVALMKKTGTVLYEKEK